MSIHKTVNLPLSKLRESDDNPRRLFGDLIELAASIKTQGVLQPLIARAIDGDLYELVVGHRRYRAAKVAGLKEVPVIVREMSRQAAIEAMLVENSQREDVSSLELANGYHSLMRDFGLSADEVADRVGMSRASVYNAVKLLELNEPARKALLHGKLTAHSALQVARVKGERAQDQALSDVLKLAKHGEPPPARAVQRLVQTKYFGNTKSPGRRAPDKKAAEAEQRRHRQRVVERLQRRVVELVERKHHLDENDLRLMAVAMAETGGEPAREVYQRRQLRPDRLGKVGAAQLRGLVLELALAPWVQLDDAGEYGPEVKVLSKAYGVSLSEVSAAVGADALFKE